MVGISKDDSKTTLLLKTPHSPFQGCAHKCIPQDTPKRSLTWVLLTKKSFDLPSASAANAAMGKGL